MKKIVIIVGGVVLILAGWYFFFTKKVDITNMPPKNETVVVFGDSLAEGVGATEENDLASLIAKTTGKAVINHGKSGDTTRDALGRVSQVLEKDPGVVLMILGGNDVLKKIPKEETFQNLEKMIRFFQDKGSVVILVGVRSGVVGDGRGDDYQALAQKTGSVYVSDILQDVFGKRQYMSDAVHPNDAGYAVIEKRLSSIIMELFDNR
ncbi:MAG: GDSL-type esterase/lipase family protein [Parcubacteria group bacterium]|jgi:lysophospholipase L1-like esterase